MKHSDARYPVEIAADRAKEVATKENPIIPDVLFDGFAVYSALNEREKTYTTPENVSAVLDAVVMLLRRNADVMAPGSAVPDSESTNKDDR